MGTVRKRGNRYFLDFYDQHGVRQRHLMPKGATKAEAKKQLRANEDMVEKGTYMPPKDIPEFSQVAADWLEYKKAKIRETTWEVYEGHVRNHFDDLNGKLVNRVSIATVEKFITKRQADKMNIGTLRKILVTLGQILSYAVKHRYLDYNPLREAERPRRGAQVENDCEGERELEILTPSQINAFLSGVDDPKYRTLFILAVFSGARQGELIGLRWGDIDWENHQVIIQRTFNNGRLFIPKTRTSKRKIDLGPTIMKELKRWRLACPKNDLGLIFPNEAGNHINNKNMLRRYFRPALKEAGCPCIRFHDLRHTYASLLIEQGENIKYIQTQLGHASPSITLNVYAHLLKDRNPESACRLENAVLGAVGHHLGTKKKKGVAASTVTP